MFSSTLILLALAADACHDLLIKPPPEPWRKDDQSSSRLIAAKLLDILNDDGTSDYDQEGGSQHDEAPYFTIRTSFVLDFLGLEVIAVCSSTPKKFFPGRRSPLVGSGTGARSDGDHPWRLSAVDDVLIVHSVKTFTKSAKNSRTQNGTPTPNNLLATNYQLPIVTLSWLLASGVPRPRLIIRVLKKILHRPICGDRVPLLNELS